MLTRPSPTIWGSRSRSTYVKQFLHHREAFSFDKANPNSGYRYLDPPRRLIAGQPEGLKDRPSRRQAAGEARRRIVPDAAARKRRPARANGSRRSESMFGFSDRKARRSPPAANQARSLEVQLWTPAHSVGGQIDLPPPVSRGVPRKWSVL